MAGHGAGGNLALTNNPDHSVGADQVHVLLRREGWEINMKRTHRIYNELGLQLRNRTTKRRVKAKLREDRCASSRVNDVGPWTSSMTSL